MAAPVRVASSPGEAASQRHSTYVSLSGQLTQIVARRAVLAGSLYAIVACVAPVTPWNTTVVANIGRFGAGSAEASVSAFSGELGCDFDQTSRSVRLVARSR